MDRRDLKKNCLVLGLVIILCVCLLALPTLADDDDETELDSGFVPIGIGVTQPDPEPAEEPTPAEEPEPEAPSPPDGNDNETELAPSEPAPESEPETDRETEPGTAPADGNETELDSGFVPIGIGASQPRAGTAPETGAPAAVSFNDVTSGKWYAAAILKAAQKGIMNGMGDGTFAPQANLTRAMLVQILYNLEGRPAVSGGTPFGDVAEGDWFAPAVAWAAGEKLVEGYEGNYDPLADITREQLVTVLWRYARRKGDAAPCGSLEAFADRGEVSSWAAEAMAWAVGTGLINGRSADTLAPRASATRAEVATLILRFTALGEK